MKINPVIVCFSLSLLSSTLYAAPVVYFDFDGDGLQDTSYNTTLGESINASLYVTNVDDLQGGLLGWGAEFNFDSTVLAVNAYAIDNTWQIPGVNNGFDNTTGNMELLASNIFSGQTGTIKLVDITFDTLSEGSSALLLSELFPASINFTGFGAANGFDYDADIVFSDANATINVSAVPLPAPLLLLASGLISLSRFKRRK